MNSLLHTDENAADRLTQLGLPMAALKEAVWQGYLARLRTTANHPKISPGFIMWGETVAVLREQLRPKGWTKFDKENYESTVNETGSLAIVVTTGDDATGLMEETPSNKCPKGINTAEAVEVNNQMDLFSEFLPKVGDTKGFTTWVLLIHLASNELRSELSLPYSISNGKINSWKERVILPSIPLDNNSMEIELPNLPDIEIPIRKKV